MIRDKEKVLKEIKEGKSRVITTTIDDLGQIWTAVDNLVHHRTDHVLGSIRS